MLDAALLTSKAVKRCGTRERIEANREGANMIWTKQLINFLTFCPFLLFISVYPISAATITASSASYADVNAAIAAASSKDVVIVPAGSAIWTNTLTVPIPISIIGAGVGNTVISMKTSGYAVSYTIPNPETYSLFRLSGITFQLNNTAMAFIITNTSAKRIARIRIDHNSFLDSASGLFRTYGQVYGVIDNNTFTGATWWEPWGSNSTSWANVSFAYGTEATLFVEDNVFNQSGFEGLSQTGLGAMRVERYNTINYTYNTTQSNFYPWDMHGNQGVGSNFATMGVELYGNKLNISNNKYVKLMFQRGGSLLMFYNQVVGAPYVWANVLEECDDCAYGAVPCIGPTGQTMRVSNSYYWSNRTPEALLSDISVANDPSGQACAQPVLTIAKNVDVFWQEASFDGASGVGCGALASRPATCTVGVGYWATNQSCTDLSDMVGSHPTTPISGTLYKCTATNTWTPYYTPYPYPHPLRNDINSPTNLRVVP